MSASNDLPYIHHYARPNIASAPSDYGQTRNQMVQRFLRQILYATLVVLHPFFHYKPSKSTGSDNAVLYRVHESLYLRKVLPDSGLVCLRPTQ